MSQDIQLSNMNNLPMQGDYFPPSGGSMGGPPSGGGSPLAKIHRLLRGRYPIVVVLGLLFGAIGGVAGFYSQKPGYTAVGTIVFSPFISSTNNIDSVMPMFMSFLQVQRELLRSPRVITYALNTNEWAVTGRGSSPEEVALFAANLEVESPKGSYLISLAYTDPDPRDATQGVIALTNAFRAFQKDTEAAEIDGKLEALDKKERDYQGRLNEMQSAITAINVQHGTDVAVIHNQKVSELSRLHAEITRLTILKDSFLEGAPALEAPVKPRVTPEQLAPKNSVVRELLNMRNNEQMEIELIRLKGGGDNHPRILEAERRIKRFNELLELQIQAHINSPTFDFQEIDPNTNALRDNTANPQQIEQQIGRLKKNLDVVQKDARIIGQALMDIQGKQQQIAGIQSTLNTVQRDKETFDARKAGLGRVSVINDGSTAVPAPDKRNLIAAAGAMGGIAVPVGLMLLIGLMDSRLRYSDETDTDMSGIQLLGILPNLPDRLSDPEQAATAAHCVHQIRTMLQINGAATEQSVFAVTSAAPGDGKTSLTLALGLSFAACGSRTLLIDCDLIGSGLTRRLGIQSETGILEASSTRTILEHIRTTEISDVAILPVGAAGSMHASTLSPNALRRIIMEAKKHFDVIMIDTGPILGSIEASLVATVADGIVLTVARGQHRQVVEKSLRHLMSIGAKIAGVVFNRAQARDFERSLSNMSMRSVGLVGTVPDGNRYGPLGRAVQGSIRGR